MYAIIETGGKQYPVQEGSVLDVEKLSAEVGSEVVLDRVLFAEKEGESQVGTPYLQGRVTCEIVDHGRGPKIDVFKLKKRQDYRKRIGHRQDYTRVKVNAIEV